jgi:chromosome segregation ATPase
MAKKKLEIDLHSLKIDMASSKDELEAQRHQNQADAHALATLQHQQSLLHDENSRLLDEINNLKSTERSTIPDAAAQIQRLKGEKKQLKAYAISLKNQMEEYEKDSKVKVQHSESDLKVANSLVKKMTPLLRSLERELAGLQGLKNEYVAKKGLSSGNTSDNLVKMTTAAIESGMNTSDNVGMMLDYADMKLSAMETNTGNKKTVDQNSSDLNETRQENHKPVVVHTGSVFGDVVTSPPSAHHSTSTLSSSPSPKNTLGPTDHPSTCTCVKCKAPAKRTSMMETVINSLLDPEPNDSAK